MVSCRVLLASTLALAAPIAAQTSAQIVTTLTSLTTKSRAILPDAQSISLVNGPLFIIGQGPIPKVINGFRDIVVTATNALAADDRQPIAAGADSDAISTAFRTFVSAHQEVLNVLITKVEFFLPQVGTEPMVAILRQDEGVLDTLTFSLIDKVASRASDITAAGNDLDKTLTAAINAFSNVLPTSKRSMRFARRDMVAVA
ncbi:hypothetical protein CC86DRAFT_306745 [Ophiobolus disseminans]|uniref:UVI-1h n=1 Tax=Ophiobolus disseminans TaxID=1469910 RepID=A0A6A6ZF28_9PLEO|nr:hypothetical protein CC86DRAFT_306745 [Ophiobolus disseminans]